ncbi:MAG: 6,7-dimethyl-8-ribityllumazine synthase [Polyangiaceae bacterium]|jgi:6,7-dimethyl-8-ribityllumazine synthase|nr:6,7-dimethyl-8-ribityllumazine synthase [Polyangiaceae bacterium]
MSEHDKKTTAIEGALIVPPGARFAIVASRFNSFIVERLIEGAIDALVRHGCDLNLVSVIRVPGAWEMPPVVRRLATSGKVDGIVAVGTVIRGGTPHFDYIAAEVSKGLAHVGLDNPSVPIAFGVLTTDTIEQAVERAGTKAGNKGFDAAMSAIEMVALGRALSSAGL